MLLFSVWPDWSEVMNAIRRAPLSALGDLEPSCQVVQAIQTSAACLRAELFCRWFLADPGLLNLARAGFWDETRTKPGEDV